MQFKKKVDAISLANLLTASKKLLSVAMNEDYDEIKAFYDNEFMSIFNQSVGMINAMKQQS